MLNKIKTVISLLKTGKFDLAFYKLCEKLGFKNILPPYRLGW